MKAAEVHAIRVLLIEDDPFVRATLKRMLALLGCTEVQEAGDGGAALALLDAGFRPELVICDLQMEPMDGLSFLEGLRCADDLALAKVPVIMLTALSDKETMRPTAGLAVSSFLLKPVYGAQLAAHINAIFRRGGAARQAQERQSPPALDPAGA